MKSGSSDSNQRADVLVLEDEHRLRSFILRALPEMGLRGVGAADPEQGERALGGHDPLVLLLDIRLGRFSGLEALERWRERGDQRPAVIMTAFADVPAAQRAIRCGASDFVTKPFTLAELERALSRACAAARAAALTPDLARAGAVEARADDAPLSLDRAKRLALDEALRRAEGNKRVAASELGISRRTLYNWLERYGGS